MHNVDCCLLDVDCWLFNVDCWLFNVDCWLLNVDCWFSPRMIGLTRTMIRIEICKRERTVAMATVQHLARNVSSFFCQFLARSGIGRGLPAQATNVARPSDGTTVRAGGGFPWHSFLILTIDSYDDWLSKMLDQCFVCALLVFSFACLLLLIFVLVLAFALAKCCLCLVIMIDYPFRILILLHNSAWSIVRTTYDLFLCSVRFLHNFRHFSLKMKIIVNFSLHFHLVPFWRDVLRPI